MRTPRIIIVGAGIGGLTAALELAHAGWAVCVCEAQDDVGGKLRQVTFEGNAGIDCGPTVFTMRWVFEEIFERLGLGLGDILTLEPMELLARHSWDVGGQLDLFSDEARSVDAIARLSGPAEARRYREFCQTSRRVFDVLDETYMRSSRPSVAQLVHRIGRRNIAGLASIHPFRTLSAELSRYFHDPRLRQLFGRYATYCGSSPYQAPGTLMLVAHAEQRGVWMVHGGMRQLAVAFSDLSKRFGAEIRCSTPVSEILTKGRRVTGVRLQSGETLEADAVLFNGDVNALATGLLGAELRARMRGTEVSRSSRSQSAVTWSMMGSAEGYELAPHTVFFGRDYESEFRDVFRDRRLPRNPTVYVHAPDRVGNDAHPAGVPERLFLLVNAPADGDAEGDAPEEIERCQESMLRLMRRCGLKLRWQPQEMVRSTPADFSRRFPATGGALYGRASHGWRASFQRSGSRTPLKGLYLAGGSVHPGPGVPMAALSGHLAARCLVTDFRSQARLHPVATIGGMPTA